MKREVKVKMNFMHEDSYYIKEEIKSIDVQQDLPSQILPPQATIPIGIQEDKEYLEL